MSEIVSSQSGRNKSAKHKGSNRRSTRVDLTPMVDLGFLLITFFVFTTNLSKANAMKFTFPKDGKPKDVKESASMTIILGEAHQVYYYERKLDLVNGLSQVKRTTFPGIRQLITAKKRSTNLDDLMFVIKASSEARFKDFIDLLDEMTICDIPLGHFAEVELTPEERVIIKLIPKGN